MSQRRKLAEDVDLILSDVQMVSPALDSNPDSVLFVSIPVPGIRTHTDRSGNVTQRGEMVLTTICDRKFGNGKWGPGAEIFETTEDNFIHRGLLARIPAPILEPRWRTDSWSQFLDGRAPAISPWDVFKTVREKFEYYIDFASSQHSPTVCATYVLLSYVYFLFEYCPYLKLGGEKGSGKTKTGTIFASLGFNGLLSANSTKAVIYRFAQDTRGLMTIDEGENLAHKSDEMQAYHAVLNSGYQRNGYAILSDKETLRPTKWSTYSPKVICSIGALEEVLADRAFEIILLRTLNKEKADRETSLTSREWLPIRDELYLFAFQHWREIAPLVESTRNDFNFVGRIWNLAKPLVVLARLVDQSRPEGEPSAEEEVCLFIEEQARDKAIKATQSRSADVLLAIEAEVIKETGKGTLDSVSDLPCRITLAEVTKRVKEAWSAEKLASKTVAGIISNLGLYENPKRDSPTGGFRFDVTRSELEIAKRRVFGGITELTEHTEESRITEPTEHTEETEGKTDPPTDVQAHAGGSISASGGSEPSESSGPGTCELCGAIDVLTRTADGIFICAKCQREAEV